MSQVKGLPCQAQSKVRMVSTQMERCFDLPHRVRIRVPRYESIHPRPSLLTHHNLNIVVWSHVIQRRRRWLRFESRSHLLYLEGQDSDDWYMQSPLRVFTLVLRIQNLLHLPMDIRTHGTQQLASIVETSVHISEPILAIPPSVIRLIYLIVH